MKQNTFMRIDEETKKELMLLTISNDKKSMAIMIKELVAFYKKTKEEKNEE